LTAAKRSRFATTLENASTPRTRAYVAGVVASSETRSSSSRASMSACPSLAPSEIAFELKRTLASRAFRWAIIRGRSRLSRGSPIPCRSTRSRAGNWSTIRRNSGQVRSFCGSRPPKVRMQVSQRELQRLVVSR
jgi:hypothetical protein